MPFWFVIYGPQTAAGATAGPQGMLGPTGNAGLQGATGITGPQGLQGPAGAVGSASSMVKLFPCLTAFEMGTGKYIPVGNWVVKSGNISSNTFRVSSSSSSPEVFS